MESEESQDVVEEKKAAPIAIPKPKKVLTPAQLEALNAARVKAAEKRKELGQITKREKEAKEKLLNERIKQIQKIEKATEEKTKKKPKGRKYDSSESESSSEESSSEDEAPKARRSKGRSIAKKEVKSKSNASLAHDIVQNELKERIMKENFRAAFASIFPYHKNIYD
jgi:hypothetical protein